MTSIGNYPFTAQVCITSSLKGAKHYVTRTKNQIVDCFIIATRTSNVYVREIMLIGHAFISDISHCAKAQHHLHHNFIHDKNL
jgi:hypothetical protein